MEKGPEGERRKYSHNQIAEICRDEFLRLHNVENAIYDFSEKYANMDTTEEELRANFAVDVREK